MPSTAPGPTPPNRPRYHAAESKTEPGLLNARLTSMSPERWKALQKILDAQGFRSY